MGKRIEYKEGDKVGSAIFLKDESSSKRGRRASFVCGLCGAEFIAVIEDVKYEISYSCGCNYSRNTIGARKKTHGNSVGKKTTGTYRSWRSMNSRCYYEKSISYPNYGKKGIKVADRWRVSFENFLKDMGERPPNTSLDRFPNKKGDYEPGNCRWATSDK